MTENIYGTELKNKLLQGLKKLNQAVSSTLGPGGRTVLIEDKMNGIKVTKDGVTVAKAFSKLEDEVESRISNPQSSDSFSGSSLLNSIEDIGIRHFSIRSCFHFLHSSFGVVERQRKETG